VLQGRFELTLGNDKTTLETGDTYHVPSNTVHGVVALEDGVLLDVFTPQRQDFLD
jgi:quercetin dioxygenase-like cupin family protein